MIIFTIQKKGSYRMLISVNKKTIDKEFKIKFIKKDYWRKGDDLYFMDQSIQTTKNPR